MALFTHMELIIACLLGTEDFKYQFNDSIFHIFNLGSNLDILNPGSNLVAL